MNVMDLIRRVGGVQDPVENTSTVGLVWDVLAGPSRIRNTRKSNIDIVENTATEPQTLHQADRWIKAVLRVSLAAITVFTAISMMGSIYAGGALALCAVASFPAALPVVTALVMYRAVTLLTAYVATQSIAFFVAGLGYSAVGAALLTSGEVRTGGLGERFLFPAASKFLSVPVAKVFTFDIKAT